MVKSLSEDDKVVIVNTMILLNELSVGATEIDGQSIVDAAGATLESLRALFSDIEL